MLKKFGVSGQGNEPNPESSETSPSIGISLNSEVILLSSGSSPLEQTVGSASLTNIVEEYFRHTIDEDNVFNSTKNIVEFTRENGIKNLVFVDRAARPINAAVSEYYKAAYPDEDMPSMFFINPKGFRSADAADANKEMEVNVRAHENYDIFQAIESMPEQGVAFEQFSEEHPYLAEKRDEPLLIIDTCMHSGVSISSVLEKFEEFGFSEVRFAVGKVKRSELRRTGITPDLVFSDVRSCFPFGPESLIGKKYGSTVSVPNRKRADMSSSETSNFIISAVAQRKIIRQIIRDKVAE